MSLHSEIYNSRKTEDNNLNKEIKYQSNKLINLKPIKIKSFKSSQVQTNNIKTKNSFLLNDDEKLRKSNKLLNYLSNITINSKDNQISSRSKNLVTINTSTYKMTNSRILNILNTNNNFNYRNNHNFIKLNSLFSPPILPKINSLYKSLNTISSSTNIKSTNETNVISPNNSLLRNKNLSLIKIPIKNLKNLSIEIKKKEHNEYNNIHNFMKHKYYEDVKEKLEKKLKDELFMDIGIRDKIISMREIGIFWNNVFDYCNPLLYAEKFKNIKKNLKKSHSQNDNIIKNNKNKNSKSLNLKLYNNIIRSKIIHNKNK